ncbi:MAG: O-antigen ligase family protein [Patescibacteria group bacterium]|nr:O-antigen ligase family protein [Patescibacteria group bacterium]
MLIPISFYLFSLTKKRFFLAAAIIMFSASILSFSRASYFSLAAGTLFFVYTSSGYSFIRKYFAAVILVALLVILIVITPNPLTNRFISSLNVNEGSNSGRIAMWTTAIQGIREYPWKGVGIGNFSYYVDPEITVRNPIYAHNIILDFGVETGILNALILIVLILSPVALYFRKQKPLNLAIAVTFIIFLAHSMFETPFFSVRVFPLFCILLALNNDG